MLNRIACMIVLIVGASLVASCTAATKKAGEDVDARMLLVKLEALVKDIPNTKEECQAKLKDIRVWQEEMYRELKSQHMSPKYSFEHQWMPQSEDRDPCSVACTQVLFSDERHVDGSCSLKMMMDLVPGDENKGKGEALVDMNDYPPVGEHVPVNLLGHTVTAWIYAPRGARGKPDKPNGFQVFVKDKSGKSEYGRWYNVREAEWFQISLIVSTSTPKRGGSMQLGFNPSQITVVGVKMAAGGGSKEKYKGPVFVDGVDWE